jgi:hypothetical protein
VGFEPTNHCWLLDFKSSAIDHSATSPRQPDLYLIIRYIAQIKKFSANVGKRGAYYRVKG